ncbi:S8 family serine peptidase [Streptomyces sp. R28]|uniref:S8 family serine peptidase n=1 Tax=Streptomyces sp. R28 TaxID=3238628 RepID=A0AB39Q717_9ACTN
MKLSRHFRRSLVLTPLLLAQVALAVPAHADNTQHNPSWGLDRIDQRDLPLDDLYTYDRWAGLGTDVYVLGTGIKVTHQEFSGRAIWGYNAVHGSANADKNGEGTHLAGLVGGTRYGVAKRATLIAVKVLGDNGSGTDTDLIDGIQWAVRRAVRGGSTNRSVVLISSSSSGLSPAVNKAVAAAVNAGVVVVVPAGNSNSDASSFSPASEPLAITVGALAHGILNNAETKTLSSNNGKSLDLFAPGADMPSAWIGSDTATQKRSGTGVAAALVAGTAASRLLTGPNPGAVATQLISSATTGHMISLGLTGTPNRILYSR